MPIVSYQRTSYHLFLIFEQYEECLRRQGGQVVVVFHARAVLGHEQSALPAPDIELQPN